MKKIHIGSKINFVEVLDNVYELKDFQSFIDYAIDNPIAEFDTQNWNRQAIEALMFQKFGRCDNGIYDIPEGYRVEVKEKYPTPPKDGLLTEYPDGTKLYGGWATRLEDWRKLDNPKIASLKEEN